MADRTYAVHCVWDAEAEVWVATSDDVPGLATGADTLDGLVAKLKIVIPEASRGQWSPLGGPARRHSVCHHRGTAQAGAGRGLMAENFTPTVKKLLRAAGCRFERQGKGDHEIWYSPDHRTAIYGRRPDQIPTLGQPHPKAGRSAEGVLKLTIR